MIRRPSIARGITVAVVSLQILTFLVVLFGTVIINETRDRNPFLMLEEVEAVVANGPANTADQFARLTRRFGSSVWMFAADRTDPHAFGDVPPVLTARLDDNLASEALNVNVAREDETLEISYFETTDGFRILRMDRGDGGTVYVGGVSDHWWDRFVLLMRQGLQRSSAFLLVFLAVTVSIVPIMSRRLISGIHDTVHSASHLSPDNLALRLSTEHTPTELVPLVTSLNAALERLENGFRREQQFLANAAHELRTPIAILRARLDEVPAGETQAALEADAKRIADLAEALLDIQRFRMADSRTDDLDLNEIVGGVAASMAPLFVKRHQTLSFDPTPAPLLVRGDPVALARVFTNLLENAHRHAGEGASVTVTLNAAGSVLVEDDGPGFQTDDTDALTQAFARGSSSPTHHAGAGLGLFIATTIVKAHGGTLTLSADGPARILVQLPLAGQTH